VVSTGTGVGPIIRREPGVRIAPSKAAGVIGLGLSALAGGKKASTPSHGARAGQAFRSGPPSVSPGAGMGQGAQGSPGRTRADMVTRDLKLPGGLVSIAAGLSLLCDAMRVLPQPLASHGSAGAGASHGNAGAGASHGNAGAGASHGNAGAGASHGNAGAGAGAALTASIPATSESLAAVAACLASNRRAEDLRMAGGLLAALARLSRPANAESWNGASSSMYLSRQGAGLMLRAHALGAIGVRRRHEDRDRGTGTDTYTAESASPDAWVASLWRHSV